MNIQNRYFEIREESRNKIMKTLFVSACTIFAFELIMFFILNVTKLGAPQKVLAYMLKFVLLPTSLNFFDYFVAKLIIKKAKTDRIKDYAVLSCLYGFCMNVATIHSFFSVLSAAFIIPVMVSAMFDDQHYTRFLTFVSCVLMCISVALAQFFDTTWTMQLRLVNLIGALGLICISQFIATSIIGFSASKNGLIATTQQNTLKNDSPLSTDPLTGLGNHTAFYDALSQSRAECAECRTIMTVALIDIDDFTDLNDTYGHRNGDDVLAALAQELTDICGIHATLFRFGGDTFTAIFKGINDRNVLPLMNELREKLLDRKFEDMKDVSIHLSTGITEYHGESVSVRDIMNSLSAAVKKAKSTGGNRIVVSRD